MPSCIRYWMFSDDTHKTVLIRRTVRLLAMILLEICRTFSTGLRREEILCMGTRRSELLDDFYATMDEISKHKSSTSQHHNLSQLSLDETWWLKELVRCHAISLLSSIVEGLLGISKETKLENWKVVAEARPAYSRKFNGGIPCPSSSEPVCLQAWSKTYMHTTKCDSSWGFRVDFNIQWSLGFPLSIYHLEYSNL